MMCRCILSDLGRIKSLFKGGFVATDDCLCESRVRICTSRYRQQRCVGMVGTLIDTSNELVTE